MTTLTSTNVAPHVLAYIHGMVLQIGMYKNYVEFPDDPQSWSRNVCVEQLMKPMRYPTKSALLPLSDILLQIYSAMS